MYIIHAYISIISLCIIYHCKNVCIYYCKCILFVLNYKNVCVKIVLSVYMYIMCIYNYITYCSCNYYSVLLNTIKMYRSSLRLQIKIN